MITGVQFVVLCNVLWIFVYLFVFSFGCFIYNIRTLSVNIKFICTRFRNRQNSEPLASFSGLFRSEYKWILHLTTMYIYCVYPAISKNVVLIVLYGVICDERTYTVTVSFCRSTWIRYQKWFKSMTK